MMITRDKHKYFFKTVMRAVSNKLIFAGIVIGFFILGFLGFQLLTAGPTTVQAAEPLDCSYCHQNDGPSSVQLDSFEHHDKIGQGSSACWACHSSTDMYSLQLFDGTLIPVTETVPSELCGTCHEERYNSWLEGTHGQPGTVASGSCRDCHDPHEPQIAFVDANSLTKPHPEATPSAPGMPTDELMIAIVILVFLVLLLIVVIREKKI